MAKSKVKWIRLSNGAVENEKSVGEIVFHLRTLALNHPAGFDALAKKVAGREVELPDHIEANLRANKLAKPAKPDMLIELYDDVQDVISCCSQWVGNKVAFDTKDLLHVNQENIESPEE
jgi:hypothetical protein